MEFWKILHEYFSKVMAYFVRRVTWLTRHPQKNHGGVPPYSALLTSEHPSPPHPYISPPLYIEGGT